MALFGRVAKTALLLAMAVVLAGCPSFLSFLTEPDARDADCKNPAPIVDEKREGWTEELGYIVVYHDDEDRTPEETGNLTGRLAEKYDFTPKRTFHPVLPGFQASLSETTLSKIRCESVVKRVSHNNLMELQ